MTRQQSLFSANPHSGSGPRVPGNSPLRANLKKGNITAVFHTQCPVGVFLIHGTFCFNFISLENSNELNLYVGCKKACYRAILRSLLSAGKRFFLSSEFQSREYHLTLRILQRLVCLITRYEIMILYISACEKYVIFSC